MQIPASVNLEQLNQLIVAFLLAGADKNAVSAREASTRLPFSYDIANRQMPFLDETNILVKEGGGQYRLSDDGVRYAKYLNWNQEQAARETLSKILREYELSNRILHFVRVSGPISREKAAERAGVLSQRPSQPRYRKGAQTFIDLLIYANILKEEEGLLTVQDESVSVVEKVMPVSQKTEQVLSKSPHPITLCINLDSNISKEKLKEILSIIKEELLEPKRDAMDNNEHG
jgi:hypothetical protein